jgi:hypothetical protein
MMCSPLPAAPHGQRTAAFYRAVEAVFDRHAGRLSAARSTSALRYRFISAAGRSSARSAPPS